MSKKTAGKNGSDLERCPKNHGRPLPPVEHRFKPGNVANPKGRAASAGTSMREWINAFVAGELTEAQVRKIARDKTAPIAKRAAAERLLRTVESGDLAELEGWLNGRVTLSAIKDAGINTEVIKKARVRTHRDGEGGETVVRDVELHDRAGAEFDRIINHTAGKPTEHIERFYRPRAADEGATG